MIVTCFDARNFESSFYSFWHIKDGNNLVKCLESLGDDADSSCLLALVSHFVLQSVAIQLPVHSSRHVSMLYTL